MSETAILCQLRAIKEFVVERDGWNYVDIDDFVELRDATRDLDAALARAIMRARRLQQDRGAA
jgi:hypothetical protein